MIILVAAKQLAEPKVKMGMNRKEKELDLFPYS
jgi:hypothetical protein